MSSPEGFALAPQGPPITPEQYAKLAGESKQGEALGVIISFTILAFITVMLRYFTRFGLLRKPGLEDYLIGVAMASAIACAVCEIKQVHYGMGLHVMFTSFADVSSQLKSLYGTILTYNFGMIVVKLSILCQYRRLFISRYMKWAFWIATTFVIAYGLDIIITSIIPCKPIRGFWDVTLEPQGLAKCLPRFTMWYINGSINIFTDVMIALIPLPEIRKLQMRMRQKVALTLLFSLGWVACVISMVRLYTVHLVDTHMFDSSWYSTNLAYWSIIELNIAIVCSCLPVLKPLWKKVFPSSGSTRQYNQYKDNSDRDGIVTIGGGKASARSKSSKSGNSSGTGRENINRTDEVDVRLQSGLGDSEKNLTGTEQQHYEWELRDTPWSNRTTVERGQGRQY